MKKEYEITSLSNPKIKEYAKLKQKKYRDQEGLYIIEGIHMVEEAKGKDILVDIFTSNENFEGTYVTHEIIEKLSSSSTPQPLVAIAKKKIVNTEVGDRIVALSGVQDPSNVGAIIRSARAFGYTDVIIDGADPYNHKALRASQGSIFSINIIQTHDISEYYDNYQIIGAMVDPSAKHYRDVTPNDQFMLVLGSEGGGIKPEVIEDLDEKVYIPIDFESLNVAAAGAILMNKFNRKKW